MTTLTSTDKIYWPGENITKGNMIRYYADIAPVILNHLRGKPLSLYRTPGGIQNAGFFHKDAGKDAPTWVRTKKIFSESSNREVEYIICDDENTLLYVANLGCVEMNPWLSRETGTHKPDYCVIDLDPTSDCPFSYVVLVANAINSILNEIGATGYIKTSGSTGLHIYIPLDAQYNYTTAKDFAYKISVAVSRVLPSITTMVRRTKDRPNRTVYIDYLQNHRGHTTISAYSLRALPDAPVSMPLKWSEVDNKLSPKDFTIRNAISRIKTHGDLFSNTLTGRTNIVKCVDLLIENMYL